MQFDHEQGNGNQGADSIDRTACNKFYTSGKSSVPIDSDYRLSLKKKVPKISVQLICQTGDDSIQLFNTTQN